MPADQRTELAQSLERLCQKTQPHDRIKNDPIEFPHRYQNPKEIEIAGFIAAVLAYGRVDLFKKTIEKLLALADGRLYQYLLHFGPTQERPRFKGIYYRFNTEADLFNLINLLSRVIKEYDSIGALFLSLYRKDDADVGPTLSRFVSVLSQNLPQPVSRGMSYLLPSPKRGSACKRLNLFLRWMIRPDDGVDFGLWTKIPPEKLIIPLDTHVIRIAKYLELTKRKTPDWKMAHEITDVLKKCNREDPLKYDFPLCHLGISGDCPLIFEAGKCQTCPLKAICFRRKEGSFYPLNPA